LTEFTQLERKLLAVLEEAGEENVAALFNTVRQSDPAPGIGEYQTALIRLLLREFIELASVRDEASRQWIPSDAGAALSQLGQVNSLLAWSTANRLWTWHSATPRIEILLTNSGFIAAKNVLSEDGWLGGN
jgi:hypothetical protein